MGSLVIEAVRSLRHRQHAGAKPRIAVIGNDRLRERSPARRGRKARRGWTVRPVGQRSRTGQSI